MGCLVPRTADIKVKSARKRQANISVVGQPLDDEERSRHAFPSMRGGEEREIKAKADKSEGNDRNKGKGKRVESGEGGEGEERRPRWRGRRN